MVMPLNRIFICMAAAFIFMTSAAGADGANFTAGPVINDFGATASVEGREDIPETAEYRISFDVDEKAEIGDVNRSLNAGARFLNMHVKAGVAQENIRLAFVIHGSAVFDVTRNDFYASRDNQPNANAALVDALIKNGVEIYVCGQSAAYYGVRVGDLLPGVKMSLSAMTKHAELQQNGYTLNPF